MRASPESRLSARRTWEPTPVARPVDQDGRIGLLCPDCGDVALMDDTTIHCPRQGHRRRLVDGILPLLPEPRRQKLEDFQTHYRTVRRAEGWGGGETYYRALPFRDLTGRHSKIWRIRARSFRLAMRQLESRYPRAKIVDEQHKDSLAILELGAGNGWFSWRMAERGHLVMASDISVDDEDGLGALKRYSRANPAAKTRIIPAHADMESIPLQDAQFDVVVATGSLHYARRIERPVTEAYRVLRDGGLFIVTDSPAYSDHRSGLEMVRQRDALHARDYGTYSTGSTGSTYRTGSSGTGAGFLIEPALLELLQSTGFSVSRYRVFEGWSRAARRLYCSLRGLAPPARFPVFVAAKIPGERPT